MARPKRPEAEKRNHRLTVYLTEEEQEALQRVSDLQERPMTQIVVTAVKAWIAQLLDLPRPLLVARYEGIMHQDSQMLRGYICGHGHPFWVNWGTPAPPRCCPVCGMEHEIKRIWDGTVRRGL